jgi:hypothetical protein
MDKRTGGYDVSIKFELGEIAEHLKVLAEQAQKSSRMIWLQTFAGVLAGAVGAVIVFGLQDYLHIQRETVHQVAAPVVVQAQPVVEAPAVAPRFRGRSGR